VSPCPDEDTLLAFLHGELGRSALATLDEHVDACPTCRDLLAALVDAAPRRAPPATPAATSLAPGTVLAGRYAVIGFLGRGGMGEVVEAEDRLLQERVAVKTLSPELAADPAAIRRLKREVLLARRISHPNVCRIFDFGEDGPIVFLTMELVRGLTLRQRLQAQGRMPAAQALPLVVQMAAGLDAAHGAGVIHRDFKGDNVLLAGDRVVITDFGLARPALPVAGGRDATTVAGAVVGTVTHAAPEQLSGQPLTPAADIHALGVVLYEMVTGGLLPFPGRSPMEIAERRLRDPARSPRRLVPDLDTAWEAAILRCLAREPEDRFGSAQALVEALSSGAPPARRTRPYPSVR
jgi:eukaryotic-like serine/threonine-protein kinase